MKKVMAMMIFLLLLLCACNQRDKVDPAITTQTMNTAENSPQHEEAIVDNKPKENDKNNDINREVAPAIATQTKNSAVNSIQPSNQPIMDIGNGNVKLDKNDTTKEKRMKNEIEKIYKGMTATIEYEIDELNRQNVVNCSLKYPADIDPRDYLSQIEAAESIISRLKDDQYTEIVISLKCPGYKGDVITLGYSGEILLSENIYKLNQIMNKNREYLSLEEATKTLEKWLSTLNTDARNIQFYKVRIEGDDSYYMFDVSSVKRAVFFVNASDGFISTYFDGELYVPVQYATNDQVEAVLSFLKSNNENINNMNMQNVKALLIDNKYVDLLCDEVVTPYLLKEKDGKVTVEPYEEFLGD